MAKHQLVIFCDGGARGNPGSAAAAFVVKDGAGNIQGKRGKLFDKLRARPFDYAPLGKLGAGRARPFDYAQGKFLGVTTNNVAEYQAVVEALAWIKGNLTQGTDLANLEIRFYLDSSLVVNQLRGKFKVKDRKLRDLLAEVRGRERELGAVRISYDYVPREENSEADRTVNETLDRVMGRM
ncbi:MAG: hypothetical protein UY21_C0012G0037 [Microgenomates group bacterium GW2011_GWA1_48_10]|uniref:RNase H type-1 domain-containing protein n=1 Tax=Candidatus Gottesmanbacteria bacterium RIFCSPHIGHO2_01_FULL_47_48 TaxID=1798381 RepID=A0A1F6A4P7_9BACT|nr:MAG: hypothetical protein UY21_C0012G0037 [Microgenomates group bacterium GW2011_GWA1_48_10]OGG19633.1 MAG: hypothetical protein A2721_00770 [Candidatus Gottesmanbacteria bacterium RIFCSPHIGHO2_01_FULL_47_48]